MLSDVKTSHHCCSFCDDHLTTLLLSCAAAFSSITFIFIFTAAECVKVRHSEWVLFRQMHLKVVNLLLLSSKSLKLCSTVRQWWAFLISVCEKIIITSDHSLSWFSENFFLVHALAMLPDAVSVDATEVAVQTSVVIVHRQVWKCYCFIVRCKNLVCCDCKISHSQHIQNLCLSLMNDVMMLLQMMHNVDESVISSVLHAQNHTCDHQHVHACEQVSHQQSQFIWIWHCDAQLLIRQFTDIVDDAE